MKRFKNILVIPSDPSAEDPALKRAAKLADSNAARLTVLWPLEESQDGGTGLEYFPDIIHALEGELDGAGRPDDVRGEPGRNPGPTGHVEHALARTQAYGIDHRDGHRLADRRNDVAVVDVSGVAAIPVVGHGRVGTHSGSPCRWFRSMIRP